MALGPARLLRAPRRGGFGQLAGHLEVGEECRPPTLERTAHGKVEVLCQRIAGPAAAMIDRFASPNAGGSIERNRKPAAKPRFLLDRKMTVEQNALRPREPVARAIGMPPSRLHEGQSRI